MEPCIDKDAPAESKAPVEDISEIPHTRPSRSWTFWLILFVAVLPVWAVVPLSWAFVIYAIYTGKVWLFGCRGWTAFGCALAELLFSVYHYWLVKSVSERRDFSYGNLAEMQAALKRMLLSGMACLPDHGYDEEDVGRSHSPQEEISHLDPNDPRAIDFRNYLRTWYNKVPWSSIRRHELYQWLHWSIWNTPFEGLEQLPESRKRLLQETLGFIEMRAGVKVLDGSNPAAAPKLLTLDPINVFCRPFIWYAIISLSNYYQRRCYKTSWGFKFANFDGIDYMLRVPRSARHDARPILLLHGLGLGLVQYQFFLSHLLKAVPDHPILVPLQPYASQEIFHPRFLRPMGRHDTAKALASLFVELGWTDQLVASDKEDVKDRSIKRGVTVISHSNGSFVHAWLLKEHPDIVLRSCFVDPVTFCSWEGDLCYNFVYRPCTTGLELLMKYYVGTELGVANFLQRHFDWNANALWYEQIPNARDQHKTKFFLGGKDIVLDASRVKRYLTSHGIRKGLWYDPDGHHGQAMLVGGEGRKEIIRWVCEKDS